VFAHTFDSWAEFEDGNYDRRRIGAGVEYRNRALTASAELNTERWDTSDPGLAGRLDYRIGDRWRAGGSLEYDANSTQLRALRENIRSNVATADATFRTSELFETTFGIGYQDYDDGNHRAGVFANARRRFLTKNVYKLDGMVDLSATSSNKGDTVPYFNPKSDFQGLIGVDNYWRQFRRYDSSLMHRFHGDIGVYDQENFGSDGIWTLGYEANWEVNDALLLRAGLERRKRIYNGDTEYQTFFNFGLDGRF